jgi:uncharacterized membrane protein
MAEKMKFKWMFYWRGYEIPTIALIIFIITALWSSGLIIAPLTLPSNSVKDLSGSVGIIDNTNITEDMNPYARFYYGLGDSQCHQIKDRSFFLNGNQIPFCVRDSAIFLGMALGLGIALFKRYPIKLWWIIGGLIPIGLDGGLQLVTSYESNNVFRLITGGLAGIVTTLALGFVLWDISKVQAMKRELVVPPAITGEAESEEEDEGEDTMEDKESGEKEEPGGKENNEEEELTK